MIRILVIAGLAFAAVALYLEHQTAVACHDHHGAFMNETQAHVCMPYVGHADPVKDGG